MASRTRNRHRMWCKACNRDRMRAKRAGKPHSHFNPQFTIKRHPSKYKRDIKCPWCSSTDVRSDEARVKRVMAARDTCTCSGYPFPHKKGTLKFCVHSPVPVEDLTEQDYLDYEACLATPRGG